MRYNHTRLEEVTDEDANLIECPECGYDDSDTHQGIAMHFGYNHEGSLKYLFRCEVCGRLKFGTGSNGSYCSKYCEIYEKVGTFKHMDENFLREKIEEEDMRVVDIAEEIGVESGTVSKWVRKYNIGGHYDCPYDGCDETFASSQGVSKHHMDKHGESIAGNEYICEYCEGVNWTPKPKDDPKFPKYCDDECFGKSMEGEDNPNKDPERRKKISETMKKVHREGLGEYGRRDDEWMMENVIEKRDDGYLYEGNSVIDDHLISEPETVEETGHTVRSSWEKKVDIMLHESDVEYGYEPRRFDIGGRKYMPDFVVGDNVIEVKGYVDGKAANKAEMFMESYPNLRYIVVGSEIPCDVHIPWEDREELISELMEEIHEDKEESVFDF